jgi:small-conductance mechanosensitive channel
MVCLGRARWVRSVSHWRFLIRLASVVAVVLAAALTGVVTGAWAQAPANPRDNAILDHLNAVINWYRHGSTRISPVGLPSDAVYQLDAQSMASRAVQLAFQSAQAEAVLLTSNGQNKAAGQTGTASSYTKMQSDVVARIGVLKTQISTLNEQIAKAPKNQLPQLTEQKQRAEGELDLRNAMDSALGQMAQFISSNGESGKSGLEGSIAELEHSVPELSSAAGKTAAKPAPASNTIAGSTGLIGEMVALYDQLAAMHQISLMMEETTRVRSAAMKLRSPLLDTLRSTIQEGQQLADASSNAPTPAAQPQATSPATGQSQPDQAKKQFDMLAARFKQIAGATLPLSQEIILLDQSGSNYNEWRLSILHESNRMLRSIVFRVLGIALAMGVILLLSELWRRITFRYVADVRRRRQFLVLRRIVMGFCMGIVIILGFVSEFSSLATFAGFITAGLAVGLQTILLSVAAYFFLVGRWGIRVGDRISVAGVTGDVVEVGLVRLYMMELAGTGVDLHPTGRIVVFSNSVLFQATTPLFKQLPGSEYAWHEVSIGLNPGGKHSEIESQVLDAVRSVHASYGEELQRQLGTTERHLDIPMRAPEPHGVLQYGDGGLEFVVRYPVGLNEASEIDDKITRKLLEILAKQPEFQGLVSGVPKIRAAVKG